MQRDFSTATYTQAAKDRVKNMWHSVQWDKGFKDEGHRCVFRVMTKDQSTQRPFYLSFHWKCLPSGLTSSPSLTEICGSEALSAVEEDKSCGWHGI